MTSGGTPGSPASGGVADTAPCPACGVPVRKGAHTCLSCGARLVPTGDLPSHPPEVCPRCGVKVFPTDHTCMSCGIDIASYRRRQADKALLREAAIGPEDEAATRAAAREAAGRTCPCCGTVIYDAPRCHACTEKALACLAAGSLDRAFEIAQSLRTVWPDDPVLLNTVGAVYEARHDGENALLYYRAAAAAAPPSREARGNVTRLTSAPGRGDPRPAGHRRRLPLGVAIGVGVGCIAAIAVVTVVVVVLLLGASLTPRSYDMSRVAIGMTEDEVRSELGAPEHTQSTSTEWSRTDYWYYGPYQLVFTTPLVGRIELSLESVNKY
ncbi:MAG: zinc ribbon domain-containing protein [Deltaproteobacteria bacterium]|nr:zinc ribbon domain-containing protein [Deltaproteobacteria bacterium]